MNEEDLEALAVYRTHKYCKCKYCELARVVLQSLDFKDQSVVLQENKLKEGKE